MKRGKVGGWVVGILGQGRREIYHLKVFLHLCDIFWGEALKGVSNKLDQKVDMGAV